MHFISSEMQLETGDLECVSCFNLKLKSLKLGVCLKRRIQIFISKLRTERLKFGVLIFEIFSATTQIWNLVVWRAPCAPTWSFELGADRLILFWIITLQVLSFYAFLKENCSMFVWLANRTGIGRSGVRLMPKLKPQSFSILNESILVLLWPGRGNRLDP